MYRRSDTQEEGERERRWVGRPVLRRQNMGPVTRQRLIKTCLTLECSQVGASAGASHCAAPLWPRAFGRAEGTRLGSRGQCEEDSRYLTQQKDYNHQMTADMGEPRARVGQQTHNDGRWDAGERRRGVPGPQSDEECGGWKR